MQILMIVAYLVVTTIVSLFAAKRAKKDTKAFYTANQGMSVIVVAALLFSEIIAGSGTIGNAANAFRGGLSNAIWANWGMALGCFLVVITVAKFYRAINEKYGVVTIPEAYATIFGPRVRILMTLIVALVYLILYSSQAVAAASILGPLLSIDETAMAWIITILFIITAAAGGMHGVAWMSVIHSLVMYAGVLVVAIASIKKAGGMDTITAMVPSGTFDIIGKDPMTTLANAIGTAISFLAAANVTNAIFGAKSLKTAKRGIIVAGIIVIPFALLPAITGICASVVLPDISANSALFLMADNLGGLYSGVLSMAIIAAIWSTAPTLLLVVAGTMTKDIFIPFFKKDATEKQQIRFSYLVILVVGVFGTYLGMNLGSILDNMLGAFQIRSVVGVVLMLALAWPRVDARAAFWSMLGGGLTAAVWFFGGKPFGIAPLWPGVAVCLAVMIPMTLANKATVSEGHSVYREAAVAMQEAKD